MLPWNGRHLALGLEPAIELDREIRLDAEALGCIAVAILDAALGVEPVAAHVEFAPGAGVAGGRVGTADDPDDEVAGREVAVRGRFLDDPERLVPEHQARPPAYPDPRSSPRSSTASGKAKRT